MSGVHKSEQKPSDALFLEACREVKIITIRKCTKIPKRYKTSIIDPLLIAASRAKHLALKANRIFPVTTSLEAEIRQACFRESLAELQAMAGDVDDLLEMSDLFHISTRDVDDWSFKIYSAAELIQGVMESDRRRFGRLLK